MNNNNKNKYLIQSAVIAVSFVLLSATAQASEITPDNIIKYVNLAREAQGEDILIVNDKLMRVAQDKLNDMIAHEYFAHTSPAGLNPWHWFQKEGYDYHFAGENLAINFKTTEKEQAAWMKSPTHRKNILDSNFQEIGVAVGKQEKDGQISIIAVQEFGATFAGVKNGEKKFTPVKDVKLMKQDEQIIPQVLSAKSTTPGQLESSNWFGSNGVELMERGLLLSTIVIMLSIALMAGAFLAVALDNIVVIFETKKRKEQLV